MQKQLDFPSFYLELTTISALSGARGTLSQNVWRALAYLRDSFPNARVVDPANTNNIISYDLSDAEKNKIAAAAAQALNARDWNRIIICDHIQEVLMKRTVMVLLAGIALMMPVVARSQVAGSTLLGVSYAELRDVTLGWSAKRQILGHPVYNNTDERIGAVEDIIVTTDKSVSYAIINAGGFLAVAKHNVDIPVSQFKLNGEKLLLPGATKDALKATPAFEYAN